MHDGKTGIILATGPSLNYYDVATDLHKNSIIVGVNSIIFADPQYRLDYYFIQDNGTTDEGQKAYFKCKKIYDKYQPDMQKFYGINDNPLSKKKWYFTLKDCESGGATPYTTNRRTMYKYTHELEKYTPGEGHSVIMTAIQFLIFTGVLTIYLVGVDSTGARVGETTCKNYNMTGWYKMKEWIDTLHGINIISINPIGLIDLFDKY